MSTIGILIKDKSSEWLLYLKKIKDACEKGSTEGLGGQHPYSQETFKCPQKEFRQ